MWLAIIACGVAHATLSIFVVISDSEQVRITVTELNTDHRFRVLCYRNCCRDAIPIHFQDQCAVLLRSDTNVMNT